MRVVTQRVSEASVSIDGVVYNAIGKGLLILVGIEDADKEEDITWLTAKISNMRIFNDEKGIMNLSAIDIKAEFLVISQFTLFAMTKKGNRPSYIRASKHEIAIPLYEKFLETLGTTSGLIVKAGVFGADMKVSLINDGPVTILIDSKSKE